MPSDDSKFHRAQRRLEKMQLSIEREIANPSGIVPKCSFCGESATGVKALIAGPNDVFICNECVALCQEVLSEGRSSDR